MWLPVSTIAALFVLFDITDTSRPENDLELLFKDRSQSEWEDAWHKEKYVRCRETLIRHLYWACEKDIYRLTRRNDPTFYKYAEIEDDELSFPLISPRKAKTMLRFRRGATRRSGSSITSECCKSSGCTWEEYAEYCPTNKRYTSYI